MNLVQLQVQENNFKSSTENLSNKQIAYYLKNFKTQQII
jgi:hypothetical protein